MGLRSRLIRWFANDEATKNVIFNDLKENIQGILKNEVMNLISDEEVTQGLIGYGDAFYDRYMSKLQGWLGGTGKGLNPVLKQINEKGDSNSPLLGMIGGMENKDFTFGNLIKMALASGMFNGGSQSQQSVSSGRMGVMT